MSGLRGCHSVVVLTLVGWLDAQLFSNVAYVVMDVVEEGYEVWQFWVRAMSLPAVRFAQGNA